MQRRDQWVGGAVLITIGVALLLGQLDVLDGDAGQFILLGIGIVLLVLFAVSRNPGTLIGGGIVTGLGAGVVVAANTDGTVAGAAVLFGLGAGFLGIWLIGTLLRMPEINFWPLIPGAILVVLGFVVMAGPDAAESLALLWPVLLIGLGIVVIVGALRRRDRGPGDGPGGGEG